MIGASSSPWYNIADGQSAQKQCANEMIYPGPHTGLLDSLDDPCFEQWLPTPVLPQRPGKDSCYEAGLGGATFAYHGFCYKQGFCGPLDPTHHGNEHMAKDLSVIPHDCKLRVLRSCHYLYLCPVQAVEGTLGSFNQGKMLEPEISVWFLLVRWQ